MTIPYIIKPESATMFIKGRGVTVASDHPNFEQIVQTLENGDATPDQLMLLVDVVAGIGAKVEQETPTIAATKAVTFDPVTGRLMYRGIPLHGYVATKAVELHKAGVEKPLLKFLAFLENLYQNPCNSIAERLYRFLEVGNMPITDDGYFLAYKKIKHDWNDIYTGTIDNSVGKVVEMPRVLVNDKDTETCSTGLHFCSYDYLSQYGDCAASSTNRVVVLKINPADVVSIPTDYNDTKGRACKYEVISEITSEAKTTHVLAKTVVVASSAFRTQAPVVSPVKSIHKMPPTPSAWPHPATQQAPTAPTSATPDLGDRLSELTNAELVKIYNKVTGFSLDRFRDKAAGIKRIMQLDPSEVRKLI